MDERDESRTAAGEQEPATRRPYRAPELRKFGTVADLTRTGGGSTTESGVGGKRNFRP